MQPMWDGARRDGIATRLAGTETAVSGIPQQHNGICAGRAESWRQACFLCVRTSMSARITHAPWVHHTRSAHAHGAEQYMAADKSWCA